MGGPTLKQTEKQLRDYTKGEYYKEYLTFDYINLDINNRIKIIRANRSTC